MSLEEKIIHYLRKNEGYSPTSKISTLIERNYYKVKAKLEELERKGEVEKKEKGRGTYWRLKDG